jgi:hypothetical protein
MNIKKWESAKEALMVQIDNGLTLDIGAGKGFYAMTICINPDKKTYSLKSPNLSLMTENRVNTKRMLGYVMADRTDINWFKRAGLED